MTEEDGGGEGVRASLVLVERSELPPWASHEGIENWTGHTLQLEQEQELHSPGQQLQLQGDMMKIGRMDEPHKKRL